MVDRRGVEEQPDSQYEARVAATDQPPPSIAFAQASGLIQTRDSGSDGELKGLSAWLKIERSWAQLSW